MALRKAVVLAVAAGLLLVLAHAEGGSLLLQVGDQLARQYLAPDLAATAHLAFTVLLFVASLGGVAVLLGAWAWHKRWTRTGNLLVGLGAGMGVLGLAVLAFVSLGSGQGQQLVAWLLGPAGLGVVLSFAARWSAR
jgi:hypothetical protein